MNMKIMVRAIVFSVFGTVTKGLLPGLEEVEIRDHPK